MWIPAIPLSATYIQAHEKRVDWHVVVSTTDEGWWSKGRFFVFFLSRDMNPGISSRKPSFHTPTRHFILASVEVTFCFHESRPNCHGSSSVEAEIPAPSTHRVAANPDGVRRVCHNAGAPALADLPRSVLPA